MKPKNNIKILTQTAEFLHRDLSNILLDNEPNKTLYEKALGEAESIALQLRVAHETLNPVCHSQYKKPQSTKAINLLGKVELLRYNWLHIELNTLLPHCRFAVPAYLTDTLHKLLQGFVANGGRLPKYEKAFMVIEEHCNIKRRNVFDEDNKGWKAIPNALKGIVIEDDDQFSLELALLSRISDTPSCHIYIMNQTDADVFFSIRNEL